MGGMDALTVVCPIVPTGVTHVAALKPAVGELTVTVVLPCPNPFACPDHPANAECSRKKDSPSKKAERRVEVDFIGKNINFYHEKASQSNSFLEQSIIFSGI